MRLSVRRNVLSSWDDPLCIGIRIWAACGCRIEITQVQGFAIGLDCRGGSGSGFAYNDVYPMWFRENGTNIRLSTNTGGWANANNFWGGSLSYYSQDATSPHAGRPRIGVHIVSDSGEIQNGNAFWGTSFELFNSDTTGLCRCVVIDSGWGNTFNSIRNEDSGTIFLTETGVSTKNSYSLYGIGEENENLQGHSIHGPVKVLTRMRSPLVGAARDAIPLVPLHIGEGNAAGLFGNGAGGPFTPQVVNSQLSGVAGIGVSVDDPVNKRRAALFLNQTSGLWGLSLAFDTGTIPFVVFSGITESMRLTESLMTVNALRSVGYVQADRTDNIALYAPNGGMWLGGYVPNVVRGLLKVGEASVPDGCAVLDVAATDRGFLPPRMTKAQRNAIVSPVNGLVVYQTDATPGLRVRENGAWVKYTATADA
jgi:hypothetical protein